MSKQKTMWIVAFLLVPLVFLAGWYFAIRPQNAHVSRLQDETAAQQQTNAKLHSQLARLTLEEKQVPAEQASIAAAQRRIPSTPGLASYIRTLSADAAATNVELVSVAPAPPAVVKLAKPSAAPKPQGSAAAAPTPSTAVGAPLSSIPVTIQVVGDYFAVQQFLSKLEAEQRITVVSALRLKPGQLPQPQVTAASTASRTGADWRTLEATITAAIFIAPTTPTAATGKPHAQATVPAVPSPKPSPTTPSK